MAVKRVTSGQRVAAVAKDLGLVEQTLRNWVKAAKKGKLSAAARTIVYEHLRPQRFADALSDDLGDGIDAAPCRR